MQKKGKRTTGTAYRRAMSAKHTDDRMRVVTRRYMPWAGYVDWGWAEGKWQPVGRYIKYPKNSKARKHLKRYSNKLVRRKKEACQGSQYRKCFDYWWNLW